MSSPTELNPHAMLLKNSIETELQRRAIDLAIRRKSYYLGAFKFSFVALLLVGAVIDLWAPLAPTVRWIFLFTWVAVLGFLLRQYFISKRTLYTAQQVARDYEQSTQSKDLTLSTAVDPTVIESASLDPKRQALLDRLQSAADVKLQAIPHSKVNSRWNFKWRIWTLIAMCALLLVGFKTRWVPVERLLLPWANISYTRVFIIHEGALNPVPGESYQVQGFIQGRHADRVEVYQKGQAKRIAAGAVSRDRSFTLSLPAVESETYIYAKAGDGKSELIRVFPFNFETGLEYEITLTPPNYTQSEQVTVTHPNLTVLRGSRLTYRVRLPSNFRTVLWDQVESLVNEQPLANRLNSFRPGESGTRHWISDGTRLTESFRYYLKLIDQKSSQYSNEIPFEIQVVPDAAPSIRLTQISDEEELLNDPRQLRLRIQIEDDVGLARAELVIRKLGNPSTEIPLELSGETPITQWKGQHSPDLSSMELTSGEILIVQGRATDNNTMDGPGVGLSELLFIEIPFPPNENDSGGGGGAGESVVINPLENQKRILNDTISFIRGDSDLSLETLVLDQTQNLDWTKQLTEDLEASDADLPILVQLYRANAAMDRASDALAGSDMEAALMEEEEALAGLVEALKLMGQQPPGEPSESSQPGMTISLQQPSSRSQSEGDPNAEQNAIEELLNQLRDALESQQGLQDQLTQAPGSSPSDSGAPSNSASEQNSDTDENDAEQESNDNPWDQEESALAQQVESLMNQLTALGMPWMAGQNPGGMAAMQSALEQLQNASEAEQAAALAFASERLETAEELAGAGAGAMEEALNQLESLLMGDTITGVESVSAPGNYQRWVTDYLRSVSYEE